MLICRPIVITARGFGVVQPKNGSISCGILFSLLSICRSERVSDLVNCCVFRGVLERVLCDAEQSESWRSSSCVRHCSISTASCCRRYRQCPAFQVTVTVTVTEALVLRLLLESRGRITDSIRILVNETKTFSDHDETSPLITAVSAPLVHQWHGAWEVDWTWRMPRGGLLLRCDEGSKVPDVLPTFRCFLSLQFFKSPWHFFFIFASLK